MGKKTKALSGASQDAYFRRVLKAHAALTAEERDTIVRRLRDDIALLRVRAAQAAGESVQGAAVEPVPASPAPAAAEDVAAAQSFNPFSPNVLVVLRKSGREAALAALAAIDNVENLRLLAREQRLSIAADLGTAADVRNAIVAAAERRIANRVAAAG
jgi:hypothetical protein